MTSMTGNENAWDEFEKHYLDHIENNVLPEYRQIFNKHNEGHKVSQPINKSSIPIEC